MQPEPSARDVSAVLQNPCMAGAVLLHTSPGCASSTASGHTPPQWHSLASKKLQKKKKNPKKTESKAKRVLCPQICINTAQTNRRTLHTATEKEAAAPCAAKEPLLYSTTTTQQCMQAVAELPQRTLERNEGADSSASRYNT